MRRLAQSMHVSTNVSTLEVEAYGMLQCCSDDLGAIS